MAHGNIVVQSYNLEGNTVCVDIFMRAIDDAPLTDAGLMIDRAALAAPIKLSAGKKRHALVTLQ